MYFKKLFFYCLKQNWYSNFLNWKQPETANGCCGTILVSGTECTAAGSYNSRDYYQCTDFADHVIVQTGTKWISGTTGLPSGAYSYNGYIDSTATCPPFGAWNMGKSVFCKSSGFDDVDDCVEGKVLKNSNFDFPKQRHQVVVPR